MESGCYPHDTNRFRTRSILQPNALARTGSYAWSQDGVSVLDRRKSNKRQDLSARCRSVPVRGILGPILKTGPVLPTTQENSQGHKREMAAKSGRGWIKLI